MLVHFRAEPNSSIECDAIELNSFQQGRERWKGRNRSNRRRRRRREKNARHQKSFLLGRKILLLLLLFYRRGNQKKCGVMNDS